MYAFIHLFLKQLGRDYCAVDFAGQVRASFTLPNLSTRTGACGTLEPGRDKGAVPRLLLTQWSYDQTDVDLTGLDQTYANDRQKKRREREQELGRDQERER